jgi:SAM-dependent methyltransferase
LLEFTGERVIPGQAGVDLWNEHLARYAFAARFASGRRVLDAGCGTGYGSAELYPAARSVVGVDASLEAVHYARDHYSTRHLRFLAASCAALPLPDASQDLVVAFEVIEHLSEWQRFLAEARRVLAPGGQFIVSTPNQEYYAESRGLTGPNPYHVHEFDFDEFSARLRELFPCVTLFLQNHVDGIAFQPIAGNPPLAPQVRAADREADPRQAHFFVAVCSLEPQPDPSAFLYLPGAGNVLRERELHIARLEAELATKDRWLEDLRAEKQGLVDMFRAQTAELDRSNLWATELDQKLAAAQDRIVQLQQELAETISGYQASIAAYEAQVAELATVNREKSEWAARLDAQLEAKGRELLDCIQSLDKAEATVIERTEWAMRLNIEVQHLTALLEMVRASRWIKLGRQVGLGPELPNS